ncbi:MAG TPA: DUF4974 domain-containing protein, partial [Bacteroidetes bacterium]|nr:DUF4974 domain-containing protein [Bacteroidota bacterium]
KHYQFEIIVKESENYQKCLFSGSFDELSIEPVLKTLALVFGAKYTIDGNEITILHINC